MTKTIYLAGGCFWGVEEYFGYLKGIIKTKVGYANSSINNPSYEMVCYGESDAAEAVEILYDSDIISLDSILDNFFSIIDPTTLNRQGNDVGIQYRSGIYFIDESDREIIQNYILNISMNYDKKILTEVKKLENFFEAESYHQKYLKKNPNGYCHIDLSKII
ncbi:peptide-methionine (S)-S-oxide reductase MsrA [Helicobacter sp. MIT 99-5507]|uniref:peptide-methionine (S)-S-oxide reductase MsrA n=1 Tax=Helicobacter sp. MIT 99-5507 TaxID=152489 RepID=UPI000E1E8B2C|nr:peptide-methionine (S)-S-oxide reductase MsrA [Helicobacter sp. MIT 99-5507]RDU58408.1 peptide-methionine (S)-S-oxide reductase [Helicobacter sp. MIT 99-5507]